LFRVGVVPERTSGRVGTHISWSATSRTPLTGCPGHGEPRGTHDDGECDGARATSESTSIGSSWGPYVGAASQRSRGGALGKSLLRREGEAPRGKDVSCQRRRGGEEREPAGDSPHTFNELSNELSRGGRSRCADDDKRDASRSVRSSASPGVVVVLLLFFVGSGSREAACSAMIRSCFLMRSAVRRAMRMERRRTSTRGGDR
jgi:hypothetical protein